MDISKIIGQRIRALRIKNKISQEELGKRCGVSFQQIQKYEKGSNKISFNRLLEISQILNVPIEYFAVDHLNTEPFTQIQSQNLRFLNEPQDSFNDGSAAEEKINKELKDLLLLVLNSKDEKLKTKIIKVLKALLN